MGIKIKYTDPTLNEFSTDDVVINVQSGSLFFKSNTKLFKLQGDDLNTPSIIEGPLLSGSAKLNDLTDAYSRDTSLGLGTDALKNDDGTTNVNTAVGIFSLTANVDGNNNTAIGYSSLNSNVSGQANTAVGASALVALNNSGIGKNIGIGFAAGTAIETGTNNTIIGSVAGTSGLSDTIIVAAGSTERFRVNSSGNMGIGTTAPSAPLHVKGTVEISGSRYYTSGSSPPTLELMAIAATGSILPGVTSDGTTGFDLGSPTAVWRDLWLSQNSVRFVSSSGEVTRFRQEDAKALREGKPLRQATPIGGTDRFVRTQAIFHETADNHYIKQTIAGLWDYVGPGGNILNIDARESTHYVTMPSANSKLIIAGEISASGNITANSFVGSFTGAITGDATGLTGVPDIIVGSLTATSITSSIVTSSIIYTEGSNIFGDELSDTHLFNGSITSSGNISSSGTITANNIISTINGGSF